MKQLSASVTGATGFIGRHLVEDLLKRNMRVKILTRNAAAISGDSLKLGVSVVEGELSDRNALESLISGSDWVFHLAAEIKNPELMNAANVQGTKNLLEVIRKFPISRFIYLSSAGVCGQHSSIYIDEKSLCKPVSLYEKTKLEAELMAWDYFRNFKLPVSVLRPTNVFGEGKDNPADSFYLLLKAIKQGKYFLLNKGKGIANYIYVKDVANALIALAENEKALGECFFINDETNIKDFSEKTKKCLSVSHKNFSLPFKPVLYTSFLLSRLAPGFSLTPARVKALCSPYHYSSGKIREQLGFTNEYGLSDGLKRTVLWLQEKGWL